MVLGYRVGRGELQCTAKTSDDPTGSFEGGLAPQARDGATNHCHTLQVKE